MSESRPTGDSPSALYEWDAERGVLRLTLPPDTIKVSAELPPPVIDLGVIDDDWSKPRFVEVRQVTLYDDTPGRSWWQRLRAWIRSRV